MIAQLDRGAVVRGAVCALCVVVPGAIVNAVAHDHHKGLAVLAFLLIVVGFVFGGFAAARLAPDLRVQHSAAAAALAFVVVQGVLLVSLVVRGKAIAPGSIVLTLLLAACAGTVGGLLAERDPRRRA